MVKYTATKKWFMSLLKDNDVKGQTALLCSTCVRIEGKDTSIWICIYCKPKNIIHPKTFFFITICHSFSVSSLCL